MTKVRITTSRGVVREFCLNHEAALKLLFKLAGSSRTAIDVLSW